MSSARRAELTGVDRAVSEVLDEVNVRMHGLLSSGSYHREFLDWLAERGYHVVPIAQHQTAPERGAPTAGQVDPSRTPTARVLDDASTSCASASGSAAAQHGPGRTRGQG